MSRKVKSKGVERVIPKDIEITKKYDNSRATVVMMQELKSSEE